MNSFNFNFKYTQMEQSDAEKCKRQLANVRNIQATVYLERLSNVLNISPSVIQFIDWLGHQHLPRHKMFQEYCLKQGWTENKLNSVISLLITKGYLGQNKNGYQVVRTGQVFPLYFIRESYHESFLSVPFPSIQRERLGVSVKQDAEVINRHIMEWYGGERK
jgi:hypothetical protein